MSEVLVDANTKWTGARYDDTTDWPGQLQPDGVILDPDLAKMRALFADD